MSRATTWVTGAPVNRATRPGRSPWIQRELWPGSVETITSSCRRGSQTSATASIGLASPQMPSASMPAARQASSASSSPSRTASRPESPGPLPGMSSVTSIGPLRARSAIASIRSPDIAVTLARTSTCAAMGSSLATGIETDSTPVRGVRDERSERQLDDLGGGLALADRHGGPGLCLAAHERESDRTVQGGDGGARHAADLLLAEDQRGAGRHRRAEPQPAQVAVGLAAVEEPRDGLLADVAPLRERHGALVEARLLGDDAVVEVHAVTRAPGLDPDQLRGGLGDLGRARGDQ